MALFDEALVLGRGLIEPRAVVRWMPVTRQVGDALETPDLVLTIPGVERHWGRVEHVAAAICTIGDALERRVAELWAARGLPLAGLPGSAGSRAGGAPARVLSG